MKVNGSFGPSNPVARISHLMRAHCRTPPATSDVPKRGLCRHRPSWLQTRRCPFPSNLRQSPACWGGVLQMGETGLGGGSSHLSEALHPDAGRWRTAEPSDCGWAIGVAGRATTAHQASCLIGSEAGQGLLPAVPQRSETLSRRACLTVLRQVGYLHVRSPGGTQSRTEATTCLNIMRRASDPMRRDNRERRSGSLGR